MKISSIMLNYHLGAFSRFDAEMKIREFLTGAKYSGKTGEVYLCQGYYDDNNVLQDCTCGTCGGVEEPDYDSLAKYGGQND